LIQAILSTIRQKHPKQKGKEKKNQPYKHQSPDESGRAALKPFGKTAAPIGSSGVRSNAPSSRHIVHKSPLIRIPDAPPPHKPSSPSRPLQTPPSGRTSRTLSQRFAFTFLFYTLSPSKPPKCNLRDWHFSNVHGDSSSTVPFFSGPLSQQIHAFLGNQSGR
jgi:hypothetical protein